LKSFEKPSEKKGHDAIGFLPIVIFFKTKGKKARKKSGP